jgi:chemotaxis protein MotB
MARKKRHEDHQNHEAWAIPYGDLITLLLAFFVVMYSMSSVNEGKYRILSDSLVAAFRGTPKTMSPIQLGNKAPTGRDHENQPAMASGTTPIRLPGETLPSGGEAAPERAAAAGQGSLERMAGEVREALQGLIDVGDVRIRETRRWLEVEINTDILFASGDARVAEPALPVIDKLARILGPFPNPIRVEGHTDNVPIRTAVFPSNWELSAARAANVVQLFTRGGIDPARLEIIGLGEYHPVDDNTSAEGRNRNRRVVIIVLEAPQAEGDYIRERRGGGEAEPAPAIPLAAETAGPMAGPRGTTAAEDPRQEGSGG